ncbi:MAG: hypothetical protein GQ535_17470, partial [Rhodobacteraceae bacterium]|nr:hypothetical protein [Paracoccaceae bacterium]
MADMIMVLTSANGVSDEQVAQALSGLDSVAPRRLSACAVDVVLRGARPAVVLAGVDVNFVPALNREK